MSDVDPYSPLCAIMSRFGATCSPKEFYWAVNEAYHRYEAPRYDQLHKSMYLEQEPVWKRLINHLPPDGQKLRFLDIGCGTGLVEHFLSNMCPDRVGQAVLLDPSEAMLQVVRNKSNQWRFGCEFVHGDLGALGVDQLFDVITVNSVLHHVVELEAFCARLQSLLRPGGTLLTAQDPNKGRRRRFAGRNTPLHGDAGYRSATPVVVARNRRGAQAFGTRSAAHRVERATSDPLLKKGIIRSSMDELSIYAVTDFHVPNQSQSLGHGISVDVLASWMPDLRRLDWFTYSFFGVPWIRLSESQQRQERKWFATGDTHGFTFASAWRRAAQ